MKEKKFRLFLFLIAFIFIISGAFLASLIARGYRPDFSKGGILPTGILVTTSTPDGAQVYIDGKLKTATNNTINLSPGKYEVEIRKDGFYPWKKTLEIRKELVTKTDALLFPTFPDLKALTFTGAQNPLLSPDGTKVVYSVSTSSAVLSKQGLWVLDLIDRPLGLNREPRQIAVSSGKYDFAKSQYRWSPDSKQILVSFEFPQGKKLPPKKENFLLDSERLTPPSELQDITPTLNLLLASWQIEEKTKKDSQLAKLPPKLKEIITDKTKEIIFSPDEKKILYTATASASLPEGIIPPPPAPSTQKEEREIKPGRIYVYDLKEDKNFFITEETSQKTVSWFPTSKHIFIVQNDKIIVKEYDGTNETVIYSGYFIDSFAFPFPSGNKILLLTNISKDTPPNLYALILR
ncbi:MAG: PEGA domain-containing protein [Microgenomates group bacterium]